MPLILPVLIPLVVAAASLVAWQRVGVQRWLGVGGASLLLIVAAALLARVQRDGIQTVQIGSWPAPYGITLVADHLSALMVVVSSIIALAVAVYSLVDMDEPRQSFAYFPLLHVLLMGVTAAFLTGDIFNLFVCFEIVLISSFVLLALGSERPQLVGGLKYVTMNLVSSFLFLTAVGILYGAVGTLNMADASRKLADLGSQDLVTSLALLFLVAFGVKAAVFPLFFWLPSSYPTPPAAVSALFAGLLTKLGVYALVRVFTLLFAENLEITHSLILVISGLTMLTGVLGAVAQIQIRHMLSFLLISHIGFMTMGLGLYTPLGLAGLTFYMVHHMVVITALFLIAGLIHRLRGTYSISDLGGLYAERPFLALLFAISALSLAGIPPLSGFAGKLVLLRAALESGRYALVAIMLVASLLTLYCVGEMWSGMFWRPASSRPEHEEQAAGEHLAGHLSRNEQAILYAPIVVLASMTVLVGIAAQFLFQIADAAARELLDSSQYVQAVLGVTQ